ncbi:carbon-nitrogen hydrolase family protein [Microbacterium sp. F2E]|uniref:Putative amidohydrolase n=1 Tax=Microbacterium lacticum TaxID=33885 RepID=A0A4Y3UJ37_9MICO|nr:MULTISPECIES: carbon-nitrogen hydrolase family protein [Microbacterium]MCC9055224.1 carbon-nitrogen hydrolase family protein [Microbacterium sp. F2E]TQN00786.1 putative amidohydrolase [Microbacterium lacticum]GEB94132.1 hydrolase [Microbacterium lacticum]GGN13584.1 hydrolase [Microbacterium lacticum]
MSGGEASAGAAVGVAVGVAVAQFAPTAEERANLAAIDELTARAVARGAEVVLFPEYASYFVDPFDDTLRAHAQDVDGDFTRGLREIASRYGAVVVAGLVERGAGDRVRNAVVAVGADGVRAVYRKLHLYDAFGQRESDWVEAGTPSVPETFEVGGLRFALMTCYDLRFPEVARVLADAGAHVVLTAAEWVRGPLKEHHWRTLVHARAIENTLYVAGADHPPPLGVGASLIVDPQGVELAGVGTATDVAVAFVDAAVIERVRRVNPALALRRFRVEPID